VRDLEEVSWCTQCSCYTEKKTIGFFKCNTKSRMVTLNNGMHLKQATLEIADIYNNGYANDIHE